MPFVLLFCLIPIVFLFLILLPFGFAAQALANLMFVPGQLVRLFHDRTLRRNHALEHATVNVIEEQHGETRLSGLAQPEGFLIFGGADPDLVLDAAHEARRRLRAGENGLAIHPRCGTTVVAANFISAVTFLILLLYTGQFSIFNVMLAMVAAWFLARPLSLLLQRYVTTDASIGDLEIMGVDWKRPISILGVVFGGLPRQIFVQTRPPGGSKITILGPDEPERWSRLLRIVSLIKKRGHRSDVFSDRRPRL